MVGLTWPILWAVAGWLIGILVYFIGGFAVYLLPDSVGKKHELINSIAQHYGKIAMKLLGRGVLVERGTKFDLYKAEHDPEKNADAFKLDGEQAHVTNETGMLSRLHQKPFGLVPPPDEDIACYVTPELAEFGAIEGERKENGELRDKDGNYISEVEIPDKRPLVQLRNHVRRMIPGDRSLYDLDETIDLYEQSQRLFGQSKTTQYMILIVAYGVSALVMWLILTQGGGTVPDSGMPVPGI